MNRLLGKCFRAQAKYFSTQARPARPGSIHTPGHTPGHQLPPLLTTPPQPADMINNLPLVSYLNTLELDVPADLYLDLRLATCPVMCREAIHTTVPNLRVHSLRTSTLQSFNNDTYVTHLNNTISKSSPDLARLKNEANKISLRQMNFHNINPKSLWTSWYDDNCYKSDNGFMSHQVVKHSLYSEHVGVHDYVPLVHSLTADMFNEGPNDLRRFLKENGYITGEYYDSKDFAKVLKWYFNDHDVYITFKQHPRDLYIYLDEIAILLRIYGVLVNHPMVPLIPDGKFMLRHI